MLDRIRDAFRQEIVQPEADLNLARAALLIAGYLEQTSEITAYLTLLDQMADELQGTIQTAPDPETTVDILNTHLFSQLDFYGNSADYYNPDNSYLNKVLDLRRGIPLSLSIVYLEIGWRLGLPVWGIGMPRHFIVGYGQPDDAPLYLDVFNQGRFLSEDDCLALCDVPTSARQSFRQEFLKPISKKAILFRMLINLKHIYIRREDWRICYQLVDLMVVLKPTEITEIRDRGLLAYRLDRLQDAVFDIKRYLFLAPDSVDAAWLEKRVEVMEEQLLRLN